MVEFGIHANESFGSCYHYVSPMKMGGEVGCKMV